MYRKLLAPVVGGLVLIGCSLVANKATAADDRPVSRAVWTGNTAGSTAQFVDHRHYRRHYYNDRGGYVSIGVGVPTSYYYPSDYVYYDSYPRYRYYSSPRYYYDPYYYPTYGGARVYYRW